MTHLLFALRTQGPCVRQQMRDNHLAQIQFDMVI